MPINEECCGVCRLCIPEFAYIPDYGSNHFDLDAAYIAAYEADVSPTPVVPWTNTWSGVLDFGSGAAPLPQPEEFTCPATLVSGENPTDTNGFNWADIDNDFTGWAGAYGLFFQGGGADDDFPILTTANGSCPGNCSACDVRLLINLVRFDGAAFQRSVVWEGTATCPPDGGNLTFTRTAGSDTRATVNLKDTLSLSVASASIAAGGATTTFTLTSVYSDIVYENSHPTSMAAWITVNSPLGNYTGSTSVSYTVAANGTGLARTGTIIIGCQTFTVNQAA
jgi:hypothetical protein